MPQFVELLRFYLQFQRRKANHKCNIMFNKYYIIYTEKNVKSIFDKIRLYYKKIRRNVIHKI